LLNDLLDQLAVESGYATLMAWSIVRGVKEVDVLGTVKATIEDFHSDDAEQWLD
jgi:hypothetical protein